MVEPSGNDYRPAAQRFLPAYLFRFFDGDYARDGARCAEAWGKLSLRSKALGEVGELNLKTEIFGGPLTFPLCLSPVALLGLARSGGESMAAKAAAIQGVSFCMPALSVRPVEEAARGVPRPLWQQLYPLKDRGLMADVMERAAAAGCSTLILTVGMPSAGLLRSDASPAGTEVIPFVPLRLSRLAQIALRPRWAWDAALAVRSRSAGNFARYLGRNLGADDGMAYVDRCLDLGAGWADLEWIRDRWEGTVVIKGILDPQDAKDAVAFGADGVVVSNHGGRHAGGALPSCRALPIVAEAIQGDVKILADTGIRSGLDVLRALALGADAAMFGRPYVYALAAGGQAGVERLLSTIKRELRTAMSMSGTRDVRSVSAERLADPEKLMRMAREAAQDEARSEKGRALREGKRERLAQAKPGAAANGEGEGPGREDH